MNTTIIVDLDGVIFNFISPFLDLVNKKYGVAYTLKDITAWSLEGCGIVQEKTTHELLNEFTELGMVEKLDALEGAVWALEQLRNLGASIKIATSRFINQQIQTHNSVYNTLGDIVDYPVIFTLQKYFSKSEIVKVLGGDVFIDDKPSNVREVKEKNPDCYCIWFNSILLPGNLCPKADFTVNWEECEFSHYKMWERVFNAIAYNNIYA